MQYRQPPLEVFVGRAVELAQVAEVIARVEAGQPWLVAIEGDPGVGKTALARRCLAGATGLRVLAARGDQAEADLDFGLVDQLFRAAGAVFPALSRRGRDRPGCLVVRRGRAAARGGGRAAGYRGRWPS